MDDASAPPIPDYLRDAAKLFLGELEGHLRMLESLVPLGSEPGVIDAALRSHGPRLAERFHLIKGGAGFLQLNTIREAAISGERLCKAGSDPAGAPEPADELPRIIRALREGAAVLGSTLDE